MNVVEETLRQKMKRWLVTLKTMYEEVTPYSEHSLCINLFHMYLAQLINHLESCLKVESETT